MGEVTVLLERAHRGDVQARNALFDCLYAELKRLAGRKLARESTFTHLDAPSLVHETYLRLVGQTSIPLDNRCVFFAYAAAVMRSVIVDYVRRRGAGKRGRAEVHVTLSGACERDDAESPPSPTDIEALDGALRQLAEVDSRAHDIVQLRYFGGLSLEEIAQGMQISLATAKRDWQKARAFLYRALQAPA
jgi:RNA polymerase sigma factor (TIGR02999 family)